MLAKHLGKTNPMMLVPQVHSHFFSGVGEQHAVFWKLFPEYGKGAVAQVWLDLFFFGGGGVFLLEVQYSILKSLISTCVLSYVGSREDWLLDRICES